MTEEKIKRKVIKYQSNEKFLIARSARQTIDYIIKNTENFPNKYSVLRNRIIDTSYSMLENIYKANIFQDKKDKKEIIVNIEMLNYYLDEALRKNIITKKKFLSYGKYLCEIDVMIRKWLKYEKDWESI